MRRSPLRSPPRMRGKGLCKGFHLCDVGITPACAGKSEKQVPFLPPYQDHPRVCGEKSQPAVRRSCAKGSPPRMRGKGIVHVLVPEEFGITPACAGKRADCPTWGCTGWDHPRVCGEKMCIQCSKSIPQGSPPRMRGKGSRMTRATSMVGITPACAGKSARRQAGPPGPAPPPQMRLGWSPPPCTGRQCRTRKSTHARRARIPAPAHTPAPQ